ncbi:glycosyltransferase family 2 protein [Priestia sp. TRN 1309]|uniref:glycosyltransferase family 2 protein n=1 Tax=Priestia sp. TRN 1309 TaxID=3420729 RepID=UPI003D77A501
MIAAGIVLYNPEIDLLSKNIDAIISQVDLLILVDNASSNISLVKDLYNKSPKILIIQNETNKGIAYALNQIIHACEERNYPWVLTLDQDSTCANNLMETYMKYVNVNNIGILCPRIVDRNYLVEENYSKPEIEYIETCITSGSFMNVNICKEIGYYDENMFIDLVDFEYCVRVQKAGFKIARLNSAILFHRLGELKVVNFFGKKIRVTNHSANRVYYYARNSIYYLKKHKDYLSRYRVYSNLLKKITKVLIFEKEKNSKLKSFILGIRDSNYM